MYQTSLKLSASQQRFIMIFQDSVEWLGLARWFSLGVFHVVAVRCWLQSSPGSPGLDIHDGLLTWLAVILTVGWQPSWSCQQNVFTWPPHVSWALGSIVAALPKEVSYEQIFQDTGKRSCKSLKIWAQKLAHCYFRCFLLVRVVTEPAKIQWEDRLHLSMGGVAKYL